MVMYGGRYARLSCADSDDDGGRLLLLLTSDGDEERLSPALTALTFTEDIWSAARIGSDGKMLLAAATASRPS